MKRRKIEFLFFRQGRILLWNEPFQKSQTGLMKKQKRMQGGETNHIIGHDAAESHDR
jgi:hypothetical protein